MLLILLVNSMLFRIMEFGTGSFNFDLMVRLAKKLSTGIPCVRIDFLNVNNSIFSGEFTFYYWGDYGHLPIKNKFLCLDA